jgi:hypothetical protein
MRAREEAGGGAGARGGCFSGVLSWAIQQGTRRTVAQPFPCADVRSGAGRHAPVPHPPHIVLVLSRLVAGVADCEGGRRFASPPSCLQAQSRP